VAVKKKADSEPHQRARAGREDSDGRGHRLFALQAVSEVNYSRIRRGWWLSSVLGAGVMFLQRVALGWVLLFTRDVWVGGNQDTDALQKELDLSFEDAEKLKMGGTLAGVSEEQRTAILRSVSDILILEIQKTFDFFRATASGENIRRIYVAGGGSTTAPGLRQQVKEEFAMPVEELYPFRKVAINPGRHDESQLRDLAPRLAIAVGLALRSFDTP
jgi:type IV pilus assembly protein PilM